MHGSSVDVPGPSTSGLIYIRLVHDCTTAAWGLVVFLKPPDTTITAINWAEIDLQFLSSSRLAARHKEAIEWGGG